MKNIINVFLIVLFLGVLSAQVECGFCGYKNNDEDRFCLSCAKPVRELTKKEKNRLDENKERINYQGRFYSKEEYSKLMKERRNRQLSSLISDDEKNSIISKNGEKVSLEKHALKGKVTVFDFYATWCGPCKKLTPLLEEFVEKQNDVVLKKINIVRWGSPVAIQYEIKSIPEVRIYGKDGNLIQKKLNNISKIKNIIRQNVK